MYKKSYIIIVFLFISYIIAEKEDEKTDTAPPVLKFENFTLPNMNIPFRNIIPNKDEKPSVLISSQINEIKLNAKNYIPNPIGATDLIILSTNFGTMTFKFFDKESPINCLNFKKLANSTFYDNTLFHNVIPRYIIQGGDILSRNNNPDDDGEGGPGWAIEAEFNNLKHHRGTLSMLRGKDPNSGGSQFFISLSQSDNLDGKYTIFAHMVSGDITLLRIAKITSENQQAKMLCKIKIPDNSNIENWITVKDPISDKDLFSKVPISENKNSYKIALQKKLNNIYKPGIPVRIDSIRVIIENE